MVYSKASTMFYLQVFSIFAVFHQVYCGVLILSPKKTQVSGLKPFDLPTFNNLKESFKKGKIVSFKINSERVPEECEHLLQNKYTSYVPTVDYIPENIIVLDKTNKQNCDEIKKKIRTLDLDNQKNILYLIIHNPLKVKREIPEDEPSSSTVSSTTTEESTSVANRDKMLPKERINVSPNEPVLYAPANGKSLLYSSMAPVFQRQNDSTVILGSATVVTFDERDNYSRLSCTIPTEEGKIILRFRFPWENGYWYLTVVEIEDSTGKINLTNTRDVSAPEAFSHACGGETTFSDPNGTITLTLFNMQVQPKTKDRKFDDAYNCVPFMTGPICSGIFVSSILAIGLIVGLTALLSIKTMDKFDNSKTKQLTITIMGE